MSADPSEDDLNCNFVICIVEFITVITKQMNVYSIVYVAYIINELAVPVRRWRLVMLRHVMPTDIMVSPET